MQKAHMRMNRPAARPATSPPNSKWPPQLPPTTAVDAFAKAENGISVIYPRVVCTSNNGQRLEIKRSHRKGERQPSNEDHLKV